MTASILRTSPAKNKLTQAVFNVEGKSTFKEEFVTAGGVELKGVNFKNFECKTN